MRSPQLAASLTCGRRDRKPNGPTKHGAKDGEVAARTASLLETAQQLPRGIGLIGIRVLPADAEALGARQAAVHFRVTNVVHLSVETEQIPVVDGEIQPDFGVLFEHGMASHECLRVATAARTAAMSADDD